MDKSDKPCSKRSPTSTRKIRTDKGSKRKAYNASNRLSRKQEAEIIQLVAKDISIQDTAVIVGCSKHAVENVLRDYDLLLRELGTIKDYRAGRKDILTAAESLLIKSIGDTEKIAKASLNNVAYAFTQVHTARRLEEGRSTSNNAVSFSRISLDAPIPADPDRD